jgi:hypothetical protein
MPFLNDVQRALFAKDGVLTIGSFVPDAVCAGASKEILTRFGQLENYEGELIVNHGSGVPDGPRDDYSRDWVSVCFNEMNSPWPSVQLLWDVVRPLAEELQGKSASLWESQISVVFPGFRPIPDWHIDGFGKLKEKRCGLAKLPDFQLLVGVFLTALPSDGLGNLKVMRGGHLRLQEHFRGPGNSLLRDAETDADKIIRAIRSIDVSGLSLAPLCVDVGDVVLSHVMTPHLLSHNDGPSRVAVYFRVGRYDDPGERAFTDVFSSWPAFHRATMGPDNKQRHAHLFSRS